MLACVDRGHWEVCIGLYAIQLFNGLIPTPYSLATSLVDPTTLCIDSSYIWRHISVKSFVLGYFHKLNPFSSQVLSIRGLVFQFVIKKALIFYGESRVTMEGEFSLHMLCLKGGRGLHGNDFKIVYLTFNRRLFFEWNLFCSIVNISNLIYIDCFINEPTHPSPLSILQRIQKHKLQNKQNGLI